MITIGVHYGGPESVRIERLLRALGICLAEARGPWVGADDFDSGDERPESGPYFEQGSSPGLNVVFYVPGSLSYEGPAKIEPARFSRVKKLLLVAVPVPPDVASSGGSVGFVIGSLRAANAIAAEVFAKKGMKFDVAQAEALVAGVERALLAQGFPA